MSPRGAFLQFLGVAAGCTAGEKGEEHYPSHAGNFCPAMLGMPGTEDVPHF